jgi:hypothetical protein
MSNLRILTDEDVYGAVAPALRRAGIDAVSTPEIHRSQQSDESQLEWASAENRVIVTFNVAHFAALHTRWLLQGRHHAGIVVSNQRPIGDVLRRLLHLTAVESAESMRDRLDFLRDW